MFGMFYTSSTSSKESSGEKREKTTLMKLKGLLGLDSGYSDEGSGKEKPLSKSPKRAKNWGKRGKKKKLKNPLNEVSSPQDLEQREVPLHNSLVSDGGILSEEETFQDCLSELKEREVEEEEEEEIGSSCFVTPLSSPLSSRPGSQACLCVSESDLVLSSLSESDYPGSTDDHRSTSPDNDGHHFTDSSVIATDDGNDSCYDGFDGISVDCNGFNDSGVSMSDSLSSPMVHLLGEGNSSSDLNSFPSVFESDDSSAHGNSTHHGSSIPQGSPTPCGSSTPLGNSTSLSTPQGGPTPHWSSIPQGSPTLHGSSTPLGNSTSVSTPQGSPTLHGSSTPLGNSTSLSTPLGNSAPQGGPTLLGNSTLHGSPTSRTSPSSASVDLQSPSSPMNLQHQWVLHFDSLDGIGRLSKSHRHDYLSHVHHVMTVHTIKEFWSLFNHILLPSELSNSSNYHFFKSNIQPMWEDPLNKQGGKWVLTIRNRPQLLDTVWMETLLLLIGDQMKKPTHICGAVVSRRKKGDRIALWTRSKHKYPNMLICHSLVQILLKAVGVDDGGRKEFLRSLGRDSDGISLVFMYHKDALKSGSSYQNSARITIEECFDDLLKV